MTKTAFQAATTIATKDHQTDLSIGENRTFDSLQSQLQNPLSEVNSEKKSVSSAQKLKPGKIMIVSSCPEPWGGSEELWNGAALTLAKNGYSVSVVKTLVDFDHPNIVNLSNASITVEDFHRHHELSRTEHYIRQFVPRRFLPPLQDPAMTWLERRVESIQPQLAVVSMGENFDGIFLSEIFRKRNLPYVLISQKASDQNWPADHVRDAMKASYFAAERVFFVSKHNQDLTEMQLGARLSNAEVVRNPFITEVTEPLPWPNGNPDVFKLACVARMFILEKGQDLLLQVLSQEKWKNRPLEVSFFGKGVHEQGLREMAKLLGVSKAHFRGFSWNITDVWREHHALVLTSRCEGLPLSLVEAMMCGRPAIVTKAGGTAEILEDEITGFLAEGATFESVDGALERAWARRSEWPQIGQVASAKVKTLVPNSPCDVLATKLLERCLNRAIG